MSVPRRLDRLFSLLLILGAIVFLAWTTLRRVERVNHVTATDATEAKIDVASPTGYANGWRWLIVPEDHTPSYELIAQTQEMLATGSWRIREIDYENAPQGRPVYSASVYRWWLAGLAWTDHAFSDRPIALSVERAAVWSEPLLHFLLLLGGSLLVARWFGYAGAAGFALGTTLLFPFAASFLPGVPDDCSLARLCVLASVLPLLAALRRTRAETNADCERRWRRLFSIAGIAGGFGLWIDAPHQTWIVVGTAAGAVLSAVFAARGGSSESESPPAPLPWRAWAGAGAITGTMAYLVEYAPSHLGLRLEVNHPLYAVAWIGLGELLVLVESFAKQRRGFWRARRVLVLIVALAAAASLPVALAILQPKEWLSGDLFASRLTNLPYGVVATNLAAWAGRDGFSGALAGTIAPLLLLVPAIAILFRREIEPWRHRQVALGIGAIAVALPFALLQLEWWATLDALLLALFVALVADAGLFRSPDVSRSTSTEAVRSPAPSPSRARAVRLRRRWLWTALAALVFVPGLPRLVPPRASRDNPAFTRLEIESLIERAAAHWIADRAGPEGTAVLVPPDCTTRWCFHGGRLRGLGSAAWENRDGLAATIRIVTAQTGEEAQARLQEHGVTYLVLPSWNEDLQQFARLSLSDPGDAFIMAVNRWALPSWLQPVPYPLPVVPGFEGESIVVLRVTDETNRATALARMLEYFLETNRTALADAAGKALQRFPADANALVGLAQLEKARGQTEAFNKTLETVVAGVTNGFDRGMAWDRRVSLAIVLAMGDRNDLAREQVQRCLERMDADRILTLTTGALYRLQVLAGAYDLTIDDPGLRERARQLLPQPLRQRLEPQAKGPEI